MGKIISAASVGADSLGLDDFGAGYVAAAMWASSDEADEDTGGESLAEHWQAADITPDTLAAMQADCAAFQAECGNLIDAEPTGGRKAAGADFFLTRNSHGCGFWDGDWPVSGDALDAAAKRFPEWRLELDGMVIRGYEC